MKRLAFVTGALVFALSALPALSVHAAVPGTLDVSIALKAGGGAVAADGKYVLAFALYAAESGGAAVWSEGPMPVPVAGGGAQVVLGATKPLTPAVLASLKDAWLGVKVDTDPELPRVRLSSVAYALQAAAAAGLSCSGCVETGHIGTGAVTADKVGFAFAGSSTKGGPATSALGIACTGCVSIAALKVDADLDLGGNGLKAKKVMASDIVGASVSATSFTGDGSKLTGIKVPSGTCAKAGDVVQGILPDGSLKCVAGGGALPPDGIDEISNNLIYNQFVDSAQNKAEVKIPDNNPIGVSDEFEFPDVGLAQKLTVYVDITNSDMSTVDITVYDPANNAHVLLTKGAAQGTALQTSFPDPTKQASGDLTSWVGKNPKGKWRIKVSDGKFLNNTFDGALKTWRVDVQTLSSKKIRVAGDLYVDGYGNFGKSVRFGNDDRPCNAQSAGSIRFHDKMFQGCDGYAWIGFVSPAGSKEGAMQDCATIKKVYPQAKDGLYWIDPNGGSTDDAVEVVCDMTRQGGGWTLGVKHWYQSGVQGNTGAVGVVTSALSLKGTPYKLSDEVIKGVIGKDQNFDVMLDQAGHNTLYSSGNYEYIVIRNYTATWTWGGLVPASKTTTSMASYRIQDDALAWSGNLQCGSWGKWGINCFNVLAGGNPAGGAGCKIKMGSKTDGGWHHIYMAETNSDTYLYVCNGAQHSSSHNMNHRYWFRAHVK